MWYYKINGRKRKWKKKKKERRKKAKLMLQGSKER